MTKKTTDGNGTQTIMYSPDYQERRDRKVRTARRLISEGYTVLSDTADAWAFRIASRSSSQTIRIFGAGEFPQEIVPAEIP